MWCGWLAALVVLTSATAWRCSRSDAPRWWWWSFGLCVLGSAPGCLGFMVYTRVFVFGETSPVAQFAVGYGDEGVELLKAWIRWFGFLMLGGLAGCVVCLWVLCLPPYTLRVGWAMRGVALVHAMWAVGMVIDRMPTA